MCSRNFKNEVIHCYDQPLVVPFSCVCSVVYPFACKILQLATLCEDGQFEICVKKAVQEKAASWVFYLGLDSLIAEVQKFLLQENLQTRLTEMLAKNNFETFKTCPYSCGLCEPCWKLVFAPSIVTLGDKIDSTSYRAIVKKPNPCCPFCLKPWSLNEFADADGSNEVQTYLKDLFAALQQQVFLQASKQGCEFFFYIPREKHSSPFIIKKVDGLWWFINCGQVHQLEQITCMFASREWQHTNCFKIKSTGQLLYFSLFKASSCSSFSGDKKTDANFKTTKACHFEINNEKTVAHILTDLTDEFLNFFKEVKPEPADDFSSRPPINPKLLGTNFSETSAETLKKVAKQVKRQRRK